MQKAASIVRVHRLWELYLTERLGFPAEKVHRTAEEMEHIITPEMEEKHSLEKSEARSASAADPGERAMTDLFQMAVLSAIAISCGLLGPFLVLKTDAHVCQFPFPYDSPRHSPGISDHRGLSVSFPKLLIGALFSPP